MEFRRDIETIEGMQMFSVTATTDHGVATQQAAMRGGFFRSKVDAAPCRGVSGHLRSVNAWRRSAFGRANTKCRCGTWRTTCSRTNSAHSTAPLAEHEGQNPRCLQENATIYSARHASHRTRAKPPSGMPHPRKRSTVLVTMLRSGPKARSKRNSYSRAKMSKNWNRTA